MLIVGAFMSYKCATKMEYIDSYTNTLHATIMKTTMSPRVLLRKWQQTMANTARRRLTKDKHYPMTN